MIGLVRSGPPDPKKWGFHTKKLSLLCPVMMVTKNWTISEENGFWARHSAFFYAKPMKPPFFWVRWTGPIISPPYPVVTLDTFGFPVGGRLAVRRAVFRPRSFWAQKCCFQPKINFLCTSSNFFVTIVTRHQKDNVLVLAHVAEQAPGGLQEPVFSPKIGQKSEFFTLHP